MGGQSLSQQLRRKVGTSPGPDITPLPALSHVLAQIGRLETRRFPHLHMFGTLRGTGAPRENLQILGESANSTQTGASGGN